jgi:hypothetical protein
MEQSKAIGQKVKQIHHSSCIQLCTRYSSPLLIHKLLFRAYHLQKPSARPETFPKKISIQMITLNTPLRFIAMKGKTQNQKERNNNESNDSLPKNTNPPKHIPQFERDLRVSNNCSRAEPLRLS